jgi:hypothetical protein
MEAPFSVCLKNGEWKNCSEWLPALDARVYFGTYVMGSDQVLVMSSLIIILIIYISGLLYQTQCARKCINIEQEKNLPARAEAMYKEDNTTQRPGNHCSISS